LALAGEGHIGTQRQPVATSPNTQVPFDTIVLLARGKSQFPEKDTPDCLQLVELELKDFCHAFSSCRRCVSGTIFDTRTGEYTLHHYVA
jgi:hypothetical protein